jgi:hypothetical protein
VKSESIIAIELGAFLLLLSVMSFFFVPAYEKGVWLGIVAFSNGFSLVLGYKFGKGMPEQAGDAKLGQSSQTETTSKTITQSPTEVEKVVGDKVL